ncbi:MULTISPECIES: mandelate racemase/muconate lactonizing enzyme family protein [unclassified Achromobacter]|uniref:mandelate racemase/muconate lactonizing enzyme family protein n=1 Tax=unclassified Achromobacter TaxID=2626865 RepID=UPI000B51969A|nr:MULTISPECIES: mandelate racemase/muconate lactonizing enzyme family protein [unclassified Achromobacter]OWT76892.1 mandelate racemase [Achromobacter sp. HZ28]OWT77772.1 mandelate racemase [Achromobacter sp. HZ34]
MTASHIARIDVFVLQDDKPAAVRASFGTFTQRTTLLVKVQDQLGHCGWGEIWSGFPAFGAYHRADMVEKLVGPWALGRTLENIPALQDEWEAALLPMLRLAGEPGPIAQVLAGLDCALWDLSARAQGVPLYRLLGGEARPLRAYASGVSPSLSREQLDAMRAAGFQAFKFKAGFEEDSALDDLERTVAMLAADEIAMIDANCGWTPEAAHRAMARIESLPLQWTEEPIGCERSPAEWRSLRAASAHPFAGGENLLSLEAFRASFEWLDVIQPDLGKWGGVSRVVPLAKEVMARGLRYCPHAFGSTVGLALAAHVLCAVGGDGILEMDANPNPLRTLSGTFAAPLEGYLTPPAKSGVGVTPDEQAMGSYLRRHAVVARGIA